MSLQEACKASTGVAANVNWQRRIVPPVNPEGVEYLASYAIVKDGSTLLGLSELRSGNQGIFMPGNPYSIPSG